MPLRVHHVSHERHHDNGQKKYPSPILSKFDKQPTHDGTCQDKRASSDDEFGRQNSCGTDGEPVTPASAASSTTRRRSMLSSQNKSFLEEREKRQTISASEVVRQKKLKEMPWTSKTDFQSLVGFFILMNAISMGVEVDKGKEYPDVFLVFEHVFTAVFLIELMIRLRVEGWKSYFSGGMNLLDFFLVMVSILDIWIITPIMGSGGDMRTLSLLRLIRLLRLARLLRLFRVFKELTVIVSGFVGSGKTLFWSGIFLVIIVYIFAIFATERFGKACEGGESRLLSAESIFDGIRLLKGGKPSGGSSGGGSAVDASESEGDGDCNFVYDNFSPTLGTQASLFGTIDRSMLTLYVCLTEGCGFDVLHPMVTKTPWVLIFWYAFMFVTSFGILNVIIGVFCENVMQAAAESERELASAAETIRLEHLQRLQSLFQVLDKDGSETISHGEFIAAITENEDVIDCMEFLGLHEEKDLFDILDIERTGELNHNTFFEGMMLLTKGNEPAKAKDFVSTYLICQSLQHGIQKMMHGVSKITDVLCPVNPLNPHEVRDLDDRVKDCVRSEFQGVQGQLDNLGNDVASLHTKVDALVASQAELAQALVAALGNNGPKDPKVPTSAGKSQYWSAPSCIKPPTPRVVEEI